MIVFHRTRLIFYNKLKNQKFSLLLINLSFDGIIILWGMVRFVQQRCSVVNRNLFKFVKKKIQSR